MGDPGADSVAALRAPLASAPFAPARSGSQQKSVGAPLALPSVPTSVLSLVFSFLALPEHAAFARCDRLARSVGELPESSPRALLLRRASQVERIPAHFRPTVVRIADFAPLSPGAVARLGDLRSLRSLRVALEASPSAPGVSRYYDLAPLSAPHLVLAGPHRYDLAPLSALASLRTLEWRERVDVWPALPSLRRAHLHDIAPEAFVQLLTHSSALRSLSMGCRDLSASAFDLLCAARLPALTELSGNLSDGISRREALQLARPPSRACVCSAA